MAQQGDGALALGDGALALATTRWRNDAMARRRDGATTRWRNDAMALLGGRLFLVRATFFGIVARPSRGFAFFCWQAPTATFERQVGLPSLGPLCPRPLLAALHGVVRRDDAGRVGRTLWIARESGRNTPPVYPKKISRSWRKQLAPFGEGRETKRSKLCECASQARLPRTRTLIPSVTHNLRHGKTRRDVPEPRKP